MKFLLTNLFAFVVLGTLGLAFGTLGVSCQAHESGEIKVETLIKSTTAWDKQPLPPYPAGTTEITILKIVVPKGAKIPPHYHSVINAGVLLKGELTVSMPDGKSVTLKSGDALVEVVNKPHWGTNTGDVDAEIIVFYAGIKGQTFTHHLPQTKKQTKNTAD
jgi:quercetin dioxygenase-like cupin family protein